MKFIKDKDSINFCMVKIDNHTFILEECNDFKEGLSKREHLLDNEGMLFSFPSCGYRSFHMKDCIIPLDIIFIENNRVKKIYHNCLPCESEDCEIFECDNSDTVVEVLGGTCKKNNINEGLIFRHF